MVGVIVGTLITPAQVEAKLIALSRSVDEAHDELTAAEYRYSIAKAECELALARFRLNSREVKMTVQVRDDLSTVENENSIKELAIAEALVKSARANVSRLRTQVDIARSVGTSVRTGVDV